MVVCNIRFCILNWNNSKNNISKICELFVVGEIMGIAQKNNAQVYRHDGLIPSEG